jgi:NAD(P)-dependent dehydrogenase (short-subunit alcohol dehydrogenase family)
MSKLDGKTAIVTGGGSGLGETIALELAKEGAKVVVLGRTLSKLQQTVNKITELSNSESLAITADVTNYVSVVEAAEKTFNKFGRIDILVNNAGIIIRKSLLDHTLEEWNEVLSIDLTGTFLCSKVIAPYMIRQSRGKIINIASIAGVRGYYPSYAASKAGVINLTRSLAWELARYGINVNCISPGLIKTALNQALLENEELYKQVLKKIPQKRLGTPEDVARTAVFLASEDSDYINGENIIVDGATVSAINFFE